MTPSVLAKHPPTRCHTSCTYIVDHVKKQHLEWAGVIMTD